jgi:hypothetical protein
MKELKELQDLKQLCDLSQQICDRYRQPENPAACAGVTLPLRLWRGSASANTFLEQG